MAKQSIAVRTTNATINNAAIEIISSATVVTRVSEIDISMAGAAGGTFGIGFPAAAGITPTSPIAFQLHDQNDQASTATVATAWGTSPTAPTQFLARITIPAAVGSAVSVVFPEGILVKQGQTLVVFNITTTDVADITVVVSTTPGQQTRFIS